MIDSLLRELVGSILKVSIDRWNDNEQFRVLKLISHEKIYRELRWNLECLAATKPKDRGIYLKALKDRSFNELIENEAPLDEIFTVELKSIDAPKSILSTAICKIIEKDHTLSKLLDRTYNRIGILRIRNDSGLEPGKINYLRQLTLVSLAGLEAGRKELNKPTSFQHPLWKHPRDS